MSALASCVARVCGMVPGWCWAIVVTTLAVLVLRLDVARLGAQLDASKARDELLSVQLASATAIAADRARAQRREADLMTALTKAQDELQTYHSAAAGRIAELDGRMRQLARPLACRGARASEAGAAASGLDGQPGTGLSSLAAGDLVIVDDAARLELARFADSAATTGKALMAVRGLLRECWRGSP
jgi:hypothetical protein